MSKPAEHQAPAKDAEVVFERAAIVQGLKTKRWPIPFSPKGWFQVAYSDELEPGDVKPLVYFEHDLVLFRTQTGEPKLLDAFCPHLGAHLGHGGTVDGDRIRCPFHAWEFDGSGTCARVPYADKIPPKAAIRSWHVAEKSGCIYAWHDHDFDAPEWDVVDIPEYGSDEWTPWQRRRWQIKTHNIEMAENAVDSAHFHYLHGTTNMPKSTATIEGHVLRVISDAGMSTPQGGVDGQIESISYGFGMSTVRFTGLVETLLHASITPIDGEYVDVRFSFSVKKLGGADVTKGVGKAFISEISRQLEQDKPIWENKRWVKPPILCEGDGPIGTYRKWVKQFFPEGTFDNIPAYWSNAE